jgi:hypothetical protein
MKKRSLRNARVEVVLSERRIHAREPHHIVQGVVLLVEGSVGSETTDVSNVSIWK